MCPATIDQHVNSLRPRVAAYLCRPVEPGSLGFRQAQASPDRERKAASPVRATLPPQCGPQRGGPPRGGPPRCAPGGRLGDDAAGPDAHEVRPFPSSPPLILGEQFCRLLGRFFRRVNEAAGELAAPVGLAPWRARPGCSTSGASEAEINLLHRASRRGQGKGGALPEFTSRLTRHSGVLPNPLPHL
jgi:hypothetical protein